MAKRIRVGVVGCGFFAANHLQAWQDLGAEGADLVGVCDRDPAKADAAAKAFQSAAFTDLERMIATVRPDVLDIVTQMGAHRELAGIAARHGIAAIVQKPLAPDWESSCAIVGTARTAGTFLAIHENFRFQLPMLRVKAVLDSGEIGQPSWARLAFRTGFDVYKTQPYFLTEKRLAILDVGIHVLDLARVFLGEVAHVSCETQRRNPRVEAEDTATMLLKHQSGAVSLVECTYESRREPDPFPETLVEIEGEKGMITLSAGLEMKVTANGRSRIERVEPPLAPWMSKPWHVAQESVVETNRHMLRALQAGRAADTSGEDNLKTYALVEAAYQAAAEGRAITPPVIT